jgi:hypothetical protein
VDPSPSPSPSPRPSQELGLELEQEPELLPLPQLQPAGGSSSLQYTSHAASYIQRANWLATFAKLQHWRTMHTLTYLPKPSRPQGPEALQLLLGETVLGPAMYDYAAETEGVLHYLLQHMPLVWARCQATFYTTPLAFHAQLASYTKGIAYKRAFA